MAHTAPKVFLWGGPVENREDIRRFFLGSTVARETVAAQYDVGGHIDIETLAKQIGISYSRSPVDIYFVEGDPEGTANFTGLIERIRVNGVPTVAGMTIVHSGDLTGYLSILQGESGPRQLVNFVSRGLLQQIGRTRSPYQYGGQEFTLVDFVVNHNSVPVSLFIEDAGMFIPQDLAPKLRAERVTEELYWYWDEEGAANWLSLKASENYVYFRKTYDLLQTSANQLLLKVLAKFSRGGNLLPPVDLVAIGVGSSEKERFLMAKILDEYKLRKQQLDTELYYTPVDISFPLLENTIRQGLLEDKDLARLVKQGKLIAKPILTSALALSRELFEFGNQNKLFVALGGTVNLPLGSLLDSLYEAMSTEHDLLLIDAEFLGDRQDSEVKKPYSGSEVTRFVSHPLNLLVRVAQRAGGVTFSSRHGRYPEDVHYSYFGAFGPGSGEIKQEVVSGTDFARWVASKDLDLATVKRYFDPTEVNGSKVVVIYFEPNNKQVKPIVLGYSSKFGYIDFVNFVKKKFKIIYEVLSQDEQFGYFLLEKSRN